LKIVFELYSNIQVICSRTWSLFIFKIIKKKTLEHTRLDFKI